MSFESFKNENEGVKPLNLSEVSDKEIQNELQEALAALQRGDIVVNGERTAPTERTEQRIIFNGQFGSAKETTPVKESKPGDDFRYTLAKHNEKSDPKKQLAELREEWRALDKEIATQQGYMNGGQGNIKLFNGLLEQRDTLVAKIKLMTNEVKEFTLSGEDAKVDARKNNKDEGFLYQ